MKTPHDSNQPHQTYMAQAMTDRIDELINEATETMQGWDERLGNYKLPSFDKRKFAELIVRECASEILKWKSEPFPFDPDFASKTIKDHFGIK